jgi:hypothetical protein
MVFSISKQKEGLNNIIACSHTITNIPYITYEILFKRLAFLHTIKLNIIQISDNDLPTFRPQRLGPSFSTDLIIQYISANNFFKEEIINSYLINNKEVSKYYIFIFNNISYREVVYKLRTFNIIISGGSVTKRHILSFLQLKLSKFIISVNGLNESEVISSFHYLDKNDTNTGLDLTTKKVSADISEARTRREKLEKENKDLDSNLNKSNEFEIDSDKELFPHRSLLTKCVFSLNYPKREFHTYSKLYSDNNKEKRIVDISKNNNESPMISYLDSIKLLINNKDYTPEVAQSIIETS